MLGDELALSIEQAVARAVAEMLILAWQCVRNDRDAANQQLKGA